MNSIPAYNNQGHLPKGIHRCSGEEFLERFCEGDDNRVGFYKAITDIFDFSKERRAKYIFVGGSFISRAFTKSSG